MKDRRITGLGKWLFIAMAFGLFVSPASAQTSQDTDARVERLEAAVRALQAELTAMKAARATEKARAAEQVAPAVDQAQLEHLINQRFDERKGEFAELPDWIKHIKWSGDFRYRHEYIDEDSRDKTRNRHRIRVRLGLEAKLDEEWDVGFRLATGSSDSPTSTNQTIGDNPASAFSKKNIWLDLGYADYHPEWLPGSNLIMGKMKNPFYRVGKSQLIWDSDVNPEGIAAKYKTNLSDSLAAYINGGGFWVREEAGNGDIGVWGIQGYLKNIFEDKTYLLGGVSYYDYAHLQGTDEDDIGISLAGNTPLAGTDRWASDFDVLEGFAEYGFKINQLPVSIFGNYINNLSASTSEDSGWLAGFTLNKAKKPGSWQFSYDYRDLEADATVGGFTDSDFVDGGTNGKGSRYSVKYQWTKNIQSAITYFDDVKGDDDDGFDRVQLDMIFKF